MGELLEGLDGVVCLMDDVLINQSVVTLNTEKYELNKPSLKILGYWIDKNGVRADLGRQQQSARYHLFTQCQIYGDSWV